VSVCNTGDVCAEEVVQLYVGFPGRDVERPKKLLRGFQRVALAPGETKTVRFEVPLAQLGWWSAARAAFVLESGVHTVYAGGSSRDGDLLRAEVNL
jgi:beta-glucosidase